MREMELLKILKCLDSLRNPEEDTVYLRDVVELVKTFREEGPRPKSLAECFR